MKRSLGSSLAAALSIVVLAGLLTGCSDDDSKGDSTAGDPASASASESPSASSSGAPDSFGSTVNGTGYTFDVPEGWGQPPTTPEGFDYDSLAVDLHDSDGSPTT
ncbi:hypothetical protein ASG90_00835 [Nocardioides sp. Soil797]|nr:hypothetical protein ASG90_00835 [Nocardioides sp. Soil797]